MLRTWRLCGKWNARSAGFKNSCVVSLRFQEYRALFPFGFNLNNSSHAFLDFPFPFFWSILIGKLSFRFFLLFSVSAPADKSKRWTENRPTLAYDSLSLQLDKLRWNLISIAQACGQRSALACRYRDATTAPDFLEFRVWRFNALFQRAFWLGCALIRPKRRKYQWSFALANCRLGRKKHHIHRSFVVVFL